MQYNDINVMNQECITIMLFYCCASESCEEAGSNNNMVPYYIAVVVATNIMIYLYTFSWIGTKSCPLNITEVEVYYMTHSTVIM
jgi:hypothetical protein